ncbi:MAG: hypothetical protein Q7S04_00740 [Candidatus Moranbacteria bacterium]|nr:hypothetical protein [Candidatus Moranbacteria bacterium]
MTHVVIVVFLAIFASMASAAEFDRTLATPPAMSAETLTEARTELLPENVDKTKVVLASEHFAKYPEKAEEPSPVNMLEYRSYRGDYVARAYFEKSLTEKVAVYLSASKARGFESLTVGPAYYITPEMEIGMSIGSSRYAASNEDQKSSHGTVSSFFYWKTDRIESEVIVEKYSRDSNPWYYYAYVQTPITSGWLVGLHSEKDVGWGPRFSRAFGKNASLWIVPLVSGGFIVGAQLLY